MSILLSLFTQCALLRSTKMKCSSQRKGLRKRLNLNRSLGDIPAFFPSRGSAGGSGKIGRRISEQNRRKKA